MPIIYKNQINVNKGVTKVLYYENEDILYFS